MSIGSKKEILQYKHDRYMVQEMEKNYYESEEISEW
jgi:hypothetical protein